MKKSGLLFYICIVFSNFNFAQSGFEIREKVGFLAAHHAGMAHLAQHVAFATELSYLKKLNGEQIWHSYYRQPVVGGTLFLGSVGNNEILGRFVGLYGFAEMPLIKYKNYRMDWKFGTGLGYTNRPYDPILNPKNVAIGSRVNAMMCFALKQTFALKQSAITLAMDMTHFSNGSFKVPNLGINLPFVSIGYQYDFPEKIFKVKSKEMFYVYKQWQSSVSGMLSNKETMPIGGKKYPVYAGSLSIRNYFSPKSGFELNLDIISKQALLNYEPMVEKSQMDILQLGISASYLLPLNRFNFVYGLGVYVRDRYRAEGPLYIRLGCRYYVSKSLSAFFGLKTHYAKADYLEFGLTYHFKKRAQ
ncbi:MAG: hypothetical protein RL207_1774 [Bacteroidota bacterium]|jgi:hypothetical protein